MMSERKPAAVKVEREVKLKYESLQAARGAVGSLDITQARPRRLQDDRLLDMPNGILHSRQQTLRVRIEGDAENAVITFKGPPLEGVMKIREEVETIVKDGQVLLAILKRLGFIVRFRYQKYREEYARDGIVIAIDETPLGTFLELEGTASTIEQVSTSLGRTPKDYIIASYHQLFQRHREAHGIPTGDMTFSEPSTGLNLERGE
jgi:adenylate cyclase class 2